MLDYLHAVLTSAPTGTGSADTTYTYLLIDINQSPVKGNLVYIGGANWIAVQIAVAATPGGTTPTLDATLESSFDGTNWFTCLTAFTQVTTSASIQQKAGSRYLATPTPLGDFLRLKQDVGSAAGNPVYAITLDIMLGN